MSDHKWTKRWCLGNHCFWYSLSETNGRVCLMIRDTVTIPRDAWNDMQGYIDSLERENDSLKNQLMEADEYVAELEEKLNGAS
ncbi:Gp5.9-like inihibitor of recBCD nuclease [Escherichia phage HZP2]|uniref:Putative RecBCD inhibitor n=1 Tax=Escherichia phage HZP2 TaxID=2530019 RepID=A0A481V9C1_9CAUD|nr:Gp5.9-like inihibitor of recBCD nuclease [Escherichia phage HZP2]QBI89993.1 putative RecBCD inhibitor [Escherichia phage HZP2]